MHETKFRRTRLPLRTVDVPCLRVSVKPLPAANTAPMIPVAREGGPDLIDACTPPDGTVRYIGVDVSGEN